MNALKSSYGDEEFAYRSGGSKLDGRSGSLPSQSRRSRNDARRQGKAPKQYNGIHRRRRKRITW